MDKVQFKEKISEFYQLHKDGYISDNEFDGLKEQLIAELFEKINKTEKILSQDNNSVLLNSKFIGKAGQKLTSAGNNFLLYIVFSVLAIIIVYRAIILEFIPAAIVGRTPQIGGSMLIAMLLFLIAGIGLIMFVAALLKAGKLLKNSLLAYDFNQRQSFNFSPNKSFKENLTGTCHFGGVVAIASKFSKKVMVITQEEHEFHATYEEAIALQKKQANIAGFSDWFLPNTKEMTAVYFNLFKNDLGNLKKQKYWLTRYSDKMDKNNFYYRNSEKLDKYLVFNFKTGETEEVDPNQKCLVRLMRIDNR